MNKIHKRRLYLIGFFIIALSTATGLILFALNQNINVFLTPSQLSNTTSFSHHIRLGGVVKPDSVTHHRDSLIVNFVITDYQHDTPVTFTGVLPNLFREGKGIIAEGHLNSQQQFIATRVLAKHDENYMPKEVYQALRKKSPSS